MKFPDVPIGELASSEPGAYKIGPFGSSLKKEELVQNGIPVIGIENVLKQQFIKPFRRFITENKFQDLADYEVLPGDILVTTMGTIGKAAVVPVNIEKMIIDSHLFRMRIDPRKVLPEYLCFALNGYSGLLQQLDQKARGAIMDGLNTSILKECLIPLPSLAEQQRIAAILRKADRVRRLRRYGRALSESVLQGVFLEMFGDPVKNPKQLPWVEFQEICETRLGKMLDAKQQTGAYKRPYLRNENVQWMHIDTSDLNEMDFDEKDRKIFRLEQGDILICEGGEVGRCAIWDGQLDECYYQKALHRARSDPNKALPEYVIWLMWCLAKLGGLGDFTSQVTIAHLTGEKLKEVRFPLPSINDQKEFFSIVKKYERIKRQQIESERQAEHLFQSLLKRAFAGEL